MEAVKDWSQERETMRLDVLNSAQIYICSRRQYDDLFPYKKMYFYFNHPCNPDAESRSRKVEDLKYFEVHNVQEKEPGINGWDLLSRSGRSFTQSRKEKLRHHPIGLSALASDRHQRSADI
jgi:hypothetical protein